MNKDRTNILLNVAKDVALETIWPTRCVICDKPGTLLCGSCVSKIPFIDISNACKVCGEPYATLQCCNCSPVHANLPEDERDSYKPIYDRCISCCILNEDTGRIATVYKDGGERRLNQILAYFINLYMPPS